MTRDVALRVRDERGHVFVTGLAIVFVLTIVGAGLFNLAAWEARLAHLNTRDAQAFYVADGGLQRAFPRVTQLVAQGKSPFPGPTPVLSNERLGAGSHTVIAKTEEGKNYLTSTGCVPATTTSCPDEYWYSRVTVRAEVGSSGFSVQGLSGGIAGVNSVKFSGGSASSDSYDSSLGPYGPSNQSRRGHVESNGKIELDGSVYGNVRSSGQHDTCRKTPPGDCSVSANYVYGPTSPGERGHVQGGFATSASNRGPNVDVIADSPSQKIEPKTLGSCGQYTKASELAITKNTSYDDGNLTQNGGAPLVLAPGTYCFNTFKVQGGGRVEVASGSAPVIIRLTGDLTVSGGGSFVNNTLRAENFQIYSSGSKVTYSGGNNTYMMMYAPLADITVSGGSNVFGALLGRTLTVSSSQVHFDNALLNSTVLRPEVSRPKLTAWRYCRDDLWKAGSC